MRPRVYPIHSGGRLVGEVCEGVYTKRVRYSQHRLRRLDAWACDVEALTKAEAAGAHIVRVDDQETGIVYETELITLRQRGLKVNYGYGEQLALPLKAWRQSGKAKEQRYERLGLLP
jgi:hypothetical protein